MVERVPGGGVGQELGHEELSLGGSGLRVVVAVAVIWERELVLQKQYVRGDCVAGASRMSARVSSQGASPESPERWSGFVGDGCGNLLWRRYAGHSASGRRRSAIFANIGPGIVFVEDDVIVDVVWVRKERLDG